jgi:membrane-anchored protein YejM (alkaline phosphatase superfamily)
VLIQSACAYLVLQKSFLNKWRRAARLTGSILFSCLLLSYIAFTITIAQTNNVLAQQTPNFPLYNQILSLFFPSKDGSLIINKASETRFSQPLFPNTSIHYPLHPLQCKVKNKQYNILLIGVDTWRHDAFNQKVTPHLYQFSNRAWVFNQHMSGGNSTQPGLFSLFYGLPGNYWSAMMENKQGALLINEAIKQNYDVRILFSSTMIPFNKTIFLNVHSLRTDNAGNISSPDNDRTITNEFKQYINKRNKSQPFFAFLLYDSAHDYYTKQNIPSIYPVKGSERQRLVLIKNDDDVQELHNRYQNAVHFIDTQINQLIKTLQDKKLLDNTIIIITGDHGEEFDDNRQQYWGHGSNYTTTQIQVPLIVFWPGEPSKSWNHLTSHYDIPPYLMSQVFGCQNHISDYSIGENLLKPHQNPFLLVGSYVNMSIVEPTKNTTLLTSGDIVIADNKARVLPYAHVDQNILKQALWIMRKYFIA